MAETDTDNVAKQRTPIEDLKPIQANVFVGVERIITEGQIILDPNQSAFEINWGSVKVTALIQNTDSDIKSSYRIDGPNVSLSLNIVRDASFYVKFKNLFKYGQNSSHLSLFVSSQTGVELPARVVKYNFSSTPDRLP